MAGRTVKLATGTVYQKEDNGVYYFRYQLDGQRKAISLKTRNQKEAVKQAEALLPIVKATNAEVVSAHVQEVKGWIKSQKTLSLKDAWSTYAAHPDRATPATVHEQKSYEASFRQFVEFVDSTDLMLRQITPELVDRFAQYLRTTGISVATHNRKLKRLRKIFSVLKDYCDGNPFQLPVLRRNPREEQEQNVRRLSFTRDQEKDLLRVLADPAYKIKNKPEIQILYLLGLFTGQRLKDCVLLQWGKVDLVRQRIEVKQFKTGKEVSIPIAPQLNAALVQAQAWRCNEYVCPCLAARYKQTDKDGKVVGDNLVNIDVLRVIRWIGLEPSIAVEGRARKVTVYGFHSLRHSFVSHCAEAGVPKAVLLSILGTDSDIADKYYTHIGDEAQEKAIAAIAGGIGSKSDRERLEEISNVLADPDLSAEEIVARLRALISR